MMAEGGTPKIRGRDYPGLGLGGLLVVLQAGVCVIGGSGPARWLAVVGVVLGSIALLVLVVPVIQFKRVGGVAKGDIFANTTVVVDTGLYAIVRHPQFTAAWLLALALALYSQSVPASVLGLMAVAAFLVDFRRADARDRKKFGDAYADYMRRVPGWNPVAGLWRMLRRRTRFDVRIRP